MASRDSDRVASRRRKPRDGWDSWGNESRDGRGCVEAPGGSDAGLAETGYLAIPGLLAHRKTLQCRLTVALILTRTDDRTQVKSIIMMKLFINRCGTGDQYSNQ